MEINIGSIIKNVAVEKRMKMGVLAEKMGLHPGSIARVLNYGGMQVEMVRKFCVVLDYDFFAHYSDDLKLEKGINKKTECEIALKASNEEVERLKQEVAYLKQINELLGKK